MTQARWLVLGAMVGASMAFMPSCGSGFQCSLANCSGCCDANTGACVVQPTAAACGAPGSTCAACDPGFDCRGGTCVSNGTGGGSASGGGSAATGGGSATGGGTASGGGSGATGGGSSATGGGTGTTGGGSGSTGGGSASTGGGSSATGGGSGSTGGGSASTGGGSGSTGGGTASTGGGTGSTGGGSGSTGGGTGSTGGGTGAVTVVPCAHPAGPADVTRNVVVSHPYKDDQDGSKDNSYELMTLSVSGVLSKPGTMFRMGRASQAQAPIVFTPDGTIGYSVQDDGSIGAFRVSSTGQVTVVHTAFTGTFYASALVMGPNGDHLYVIEFGTAANGAGIYDLAIACDGSLGELGKLISGSPSAATWFNTTPGKMLVGANALGLAASTNNVHAIDVSTTATVNSSAAGFPDSNSIASQIAVTYDDRWVAVADYNSIAAGSRVAILELNGTTLTPRQVLSTGVVIGVVFSPFSRAGLIVNTDTSDAVRKLNYSAASATAPYSISSSPLAYTHGTPQLPAVPVMIKRGALNGRVLLGELEAVRQFQFLPDGGVTDVSKTAPTGTGFAKIVGVIGVAP